jgi:hypothetical protein
MKNIRYLIFGLFCTLFTSIHASDGTPSPLTRRPSNLFSLVGGPSQSPSPRTVCASPVSPQAFLAATAQQDAQEVADAIERANTLHSEVEALQEKLNAAHNELLAQQTKYAELYNKEYLLAQKIAKKRAYFKKKHTADKITAMTARLANNTKDLESVTAEAKNLFLSIRTLENNIALLKKRFSQQETAYSKARSIAQYRKRYAVEASELTKKIEALTLLTPEGTESANFSTICDTLKMITAELSAYVSSPRNKISDLNQYIGVIRNLKILEFQFRTNAEKNSEAIPLAEIFTTSDHIDRLKIVANFCCHQTDSPQLIKTGTQLISLCSALAMNALEALVMYPTII